MSSELGNSGIRVAVGDCGVTERWWWRPPYQNGKTVRVHAKHYKHNDLVVLLFYVHGKHLRSCRDGQLT